MHVSDLVSAGCWPEAAIDGAVLRRSHTALQRQFLRLVLVDLVHAILKASLHEHTESIIALVHDGEDEELGEGPEQQKHGVAAARHSCAAGG
jgi:hypothetical protein